VLRRHADLLADRATEPIARFSKCMVQRLAIAQALLVEAELLVLDEPAEGLDLPGRRLVRELLHEQKRQGRAALFVLHALAEAEQVCDRVGVLNAGRFAFIGPVADLLDDAAGGRRTLEMPFRTFIPLPLSRTL
jgi:ABC-2 type transport system ATP-binding protein